MFELHFHLFVVYVALKVPHVGHQPTRVLICFCRADFFSFLLNLKKKKSRIEYMRCKIPHQVDFNLTTLHCYQKRKERQIKQHFYYDSTQQMKTFLYFKCILHTKSHKKCKDETHLRYEVKLGKRDCKKARNLPSGYFLLLRRSSEEQGK